MRLTLVGAVMSRKKARLRIERLDPPPPAQAPMNAAQANLRSADLPLGSWQRWLPRVILMVFAPAAAVLLAEGGLRLFGYGYPTAFLLSGEVNGRKVFIENERFGWRFLAPRWRALLAR